MGETPILKIFQNDFWGNPISNPGSHKSYRPLTTINFRVNKIIFGLKPMSFHIINIAFHGLASCLVLRLARDMKTKKATSLFSAILFAVHPIHCEAVSGIVGRADLLSTIFVISGILVYRRIESNSIAFVLCTLATLSKESGVMLLPILMVYTLIFSQMPLPQRRIKVLTIFFTFIFVCFARIWINGFETPKFSSSDNPIAHHPDIATRTMTLLYLPLFHLRLMIYPNTLCFDWSMDTIAPITTPLDLRFIVLMIFYPTLSCCLYFILRNSRAHIRIIELYRSESTCFRRSTPPDLNCGHTKKNKYGSKPHITYEEQVSGSEYCDFALFTLSLIILPLIFTSNLFSYVGFVVAERILYLPSVGYCILFGKLSQLINERVNPRYAILISLAVFILSIHSVRTYQRNFDWKDEESLYKSAVNINPAKAFANLGRAYALRLKITEAESAYRKALEYRPNMADTWYNLGILYKNGNKPWKAVESYLMAINYRKTFATAYLNLGLLFWELGMEQKSTEIFLKCASINGIHLKAYRNHRNAQTSCLYNLGRLHVSMGRITDGIKSFEEALLVSPVGYSRLPSLLNSLGEAYSKQGDDGKAELCYEKALIFTPKHLPSHLTMAHLKIRQNRTVEAMKWFDKALELAPDSAQVHHHIGLARMIEGELISAESSYREALRYDPNHADTLYSLSTLLREQGRNQESEQLLYRLTIARPNSQSLSNYGAILHLNGKFIEAEHFYKKALSLTPNDKIIIENLNKLKRILDKKGIR